MARQASGSGWPYALAVLQRGWTPYAAAGGAVCAAKLPSLIDAPIFIDEPYYLAAAARLATVRDFALSFSALTETKSGYALLPHLLSGALGGEHALLVLHVLGLLAALATAGLLVALSRAVFGRALPGVAAAVVWAGWLTHDATTAVVNLEHFQAPLVLAALLLVLRAPRHAGALLLAGLCVGAAGLLKPPALAVALPLLAAVAATARPLARPAAAFCAGVALPLLVMFAPYVLVAGELDDLRFAAFELPRLYSAFSEDSLADRTRALALVVPLPLRVLLVGTVLAFAVAAARDRAGRVPEALLLGTGAVLFAAHVSGQLKAHYLVVVLPPLLLFAAGRAATLLRALPVPPPAAAAAAVLVTAWALAGASSPAFWLDLLREGGGLYARQLPGTDVDALARVVDRRTSDGDRIWVFYNAPEVYTRTDRAPATRDVVASWLTHDFRAFWLERNLRDLEREHPAVIAGLDAPRYPEPVPGLRELPGIDRLLAERYVCDPPGSRVRGAVVCLLRR